MAHIKSPILTASHFDFAPISHRTSALGQWATALCRSDSRDSLKNINKYVTKTEGRNGFLHCFQQLTSNRNKIKTRNREEIPFSLEIRVFSVTEEP